MTGKVCYRELLPLLLISYSRCVATAQMKAAVVSDREWPWPATPPLLLSISPPPTSYQLLPLSYIISLSIFITFRWSKNWSGLIKPPPPRSFLVRLLKLSSNWTKSSMMGPQLFSGWYQMIVMFSDVLSCFPMFSAGLGFWWITTPCADILWSSLYVRGLYYFQNSSFL